MSQPSEKLFDEVLADARTKADRARRRGERDAKAAAQKVADEVQAQVDKILKAADAEVALKRHQILATVEIEAQRDRLARLEESLAKVTQRVAAGLSSLGGQALRDAQMRLAIDAIRQLPPGEVEVALPAKNHAEYGPPFVADLMARATKELSRPVTARLAPSGAAIADGVVVRGAGGRVEIVNSFSERLRRMWPTLRLDAARQLFPGLVTEKEKH